MGHTAKKPDPDFVIRFVGPKINPWAVPMRCLTRVFNAAQRLIDQKDEDIEEEIDEVPPRERALHLLSVTRGSAAYAISAPDREDVISILSLLGNSIAMPNAAEWSQSTLSALEDFSQAAKAMDCKIEFYRSADYKSKKKVLARITPDTYDEIAYSAFIDGPTSVFARIERVGGATAMHCGIRLPDSPRKMVICRVISEELVRQLGQYMYQSVLLTGRATWYRKSWKLKRLIIESFEPPKTGSIAQTLQSAHEAGGYAWDAIEDPDAYVSEMRD